MFTYQMVNSISSIILSTKKYPKNLQKLIRNYFILIIFGSFVNSLPVIFFSLYLIDTFNSFAFAGFLLSIYSFSQFIFDFPTGALSDYIGQKRVEILAVITYSSSMILLSYANSVNLFILVMILMGIGNALFSGVLQTWFSNNYFVVMTEDPKREIYGSIMAKVRSFSFLMVAFAVLIGTNLATIFSRRFVFLLNGILGYLGIFLFILLLNDFYEKGAPDKQLTPINHIKEYLKVTYHSITVVLNDKLLLSTITGLLLLTTALGPIFIQLIFFPLVFGYTGNDSLFGLSQFGIYLVLAMNVFFIGVFAKKFQKRFMPLFFLFYVIFFVNGLLILFEMQPPKNSLNIIAIVFIILLYLFFDSFIGEIGVNLQQRIFLDIIPSKYRNSILSLYTSLMGMIIAIFYPITGIIIQQFNLDGGIIFMEMIGIVGCIFLIPILFLKGTYQIL